MPGIRLKATLSVVACVALGLLAEATRDVLHHLHEAEAEAQARQAASLTAAATLLDYAAPEVAVAFAPDGAVREIRWTAEPDLSDHALVDRIGAVTGETATVFAWDPAQGEFVRRSTNIRKSDGTRAVGTVLGASGAVHPVVAAGRPYSGQAQILGRDYYTHYEPILGPDGDVAGILYVGVERKAVMALVWSVVADEATSALALLLVAAGVIHLFAGRALGSLERVRAAVTGLAAGDLATPVPERTRSDELGELARGVETLREGLAAAARDRAAAEAERKETAEARARMLADLRDGVGEVVEGACKGDFDRRVETRFDAPELAALAASVNRLTETAAGFLADLEATLEAMARRDLSRPMSAAYAGRFARLAAAANGAQDALGAALSEIREGAEGNRAAMGSITETLRSLSTRAESQASTIEETAATMEEMTRTVAAAAERLDGAEGMTGDALARARDGAASVGQAIAAVRRIEESSARITEIIAVIDSIAFQTNLLALNAAVEAARAGDAGKGFAVVASEVRGLAQRSSDAARDISELIKQSAAHVSEGVGLVDRTGGALEGIVEAVDGLAGAIRDIAASGREQGEGVREIGAAIAHLDGMVQENARQTVEVAAEAAVVAEAVDRTAGAVSGFVLPGSRGSARRAA